MYVKPALSIMTAKTVNKSISKLSKDTIVSVSVNGNDVYIHIKPDIPDSGRVFHLGHMLSFSDQLSNNTPEALHICGR